MASIKAIAAIAMTLIVAVPILMGYGFASTEEEVTTWESESTTNITEMLLNTSQDYYTEYMNPLNNSVFLQKVVAQGGTTTTQKAPAYASVSSNYSSIPEYSTGSENVTYNAPTNRSITYTGTDGLTHSFGNDAGAEDAVTMSDQTIVSISSSNMSSMHWMVELNGSYYYNNASSNMTLKFLRDSDSTWKLYISEDNGDYDEYGSVSTWMISTDVDGSITIRTQAYAGITHSGSFGFDTLTGYTLKLIGSDSSVTYLTNPDSGYVYLSETGLATVEGNTYTGIDSIYLANNTNYVTVTYTGATGNYADPAAGWGLPAGSGIAHYNYWMNGQQNSEVRMMIHFSGTNYVVLGPTTSVATSQLVQIHYVAGVGITVTDMSTNESTDLGGYDDIMLVITDTETTVYGIKDWPTMGIEPATYNSATVDYTDLGDSFAYIYMADDLNGYSNEVTYRVDSASIVAGTYPVTYNYEFGVYDYYPDQSYILTIKSVAEYGELLNIVNRENGTLAGYVLPVTEGTITISGTTMKVRGLQISVLENSDGTWTAYVDDEPVWENLEYQPFIGFGGQWSLTASLDIVEKTTTSTQAWAPGEFAFEKEDFAACGMLVAGVCLVGLGMTGPRSGTKIGVLLMICGGAGLIYLNLI